MATTASSPSYPGSLRSLAATFAGSWQRWLAWLPLLGVTALALTVNVWALTDAGYGNTYYAAAVRSMTESWHNFFFVAFDPGSFITVDKPPVFLWVDALSARIFGYSSLALLVPSAIAGAGSVALLWMIIRRYFGVLAATSAGLVLALTPISVAVNRLNLPEPFLVLALVGAAGCILRSLDSKPWLWWTIAAGLLVGVAFNTKMLVGWIPGPALGMALVIGVRGDWWRAWQEWIPRLAVFGSVALIASASWMLAVDHWPGDHPYIGGSRDNTVYDLMLGYNGVERVDGESGFDGAPGGRQRTSGSGPSVNPLGAGGIIAGQPELLRMFDEANGGQIAWFLPFAVIGGALSLWRWRSDRVLRAVVLLWLGWALLYGVAFSYAQGVYHSYYTAALAPGIAALVGMTCVALPDLIRRHRAWVTAGFAIAGATLYAQLAVSGRFDSFFEWVTPFTILTVLAGVSLLAAAAWNRRIPVAAGVAVMIFGFLLIPAVWSGYESAHAASNTTLPQAGPRNGGPASHSFGSQAFDSGVPQLAAWLHAHSEPGARWHLAVSSAQNASTLMAEHGLSVMAIGGFSGRDPTITAAEFGEYVEKGEVRYVMTSGIGGPGARSLARGGTRLPGFPSASTVPKGPTLQSLAGSGLSSRMGLTAAGANAVMTAVLAVCDPVRDSSLPIRYTGAIYDCGGKGVSR